jgi:hypothetical protein
MRDGYGERFMEWILYAAGSIMVLVAGVDVFLTVLYARSGTGLLSPQANRLIWYLFRHTAIRCGRRRHTILSFCGPVALVILLAFWLLLFITGFALIIWPQLGNQVVAGEGDTPTNFLSAFYYSGYSFSTLGTGNIVPESDFYRILMVFQSVIGFSFFTLIITYFLSLFEALRQRNNFSLSLHGKTSGSADPSEYVARIAGDNELLVAQQQFAEMSTNLTEIAESHNFYPILQYFRLPEIQYGIPRILMISLDTISLFKSALNEERYYKQLNSAAAEALWYSGIRLMTHFAGTILPKNSTVHLQIDHEMNHAKWRTHYYAALKKLQRHGVETRNDPQEGLRDYIRYRMQWDPHVSAFARLMLYDEQDVFSYRHNI